MNFNLSSVYKNPPLAKGIIICGLLIFLGNMSNVGAFVFLLAYIRGGSQYLDVLPFSGSWYLIIAVFLLLLSSFLYASQKNYINIINKECDNNDDSKSDIASFIKTFNSDHSKMLKIFSTGIAPQMLVVIYSAATVFFVFPLFGIFIFFVVIFVTSLYIYFDNKLLSHNTRESNSVGSTSLIALCSSSVLVLPAIYLSVVIVNEQSANPELLVFIILFIRYIYSAFRGALFSIFKLGSYKIKKDNEDEFSIIDYDLRAFFTKEGSFKHIANNTGGLSSEISKSIVSAYGKELSIYRFMDHNIIHHNEVRKLAKSQAIALLKNMNDFPIVVYKDKEFLDKFFGVKA